MLFASATIFVAIMVGIAIFAHRRFGGGGVLPMQWALGKQIMWSAPRGIALGFVPVIGAVILFAIAFGEGRDPSGEAGAALEVQAMIGVALVAGQLLHLWLIRRTVGR